MNSDVKQEHQKLWNQSKVSIEYDFLKGYIKTPKQVNKLSETYSGPRNRMLLDKFDPKKTYNSDQE